MAGAEEVNEGAELALGKGDVTNMGEDTVGEKRLRGPAAVWLPPVQTGCVLEGDQALLAVCSGTLATCRRHFTGQSAGHATVP